MNITGRWKGLDHTFSETHAGAIKDKIIVIQGQEDNEIKQ